MKNAHHGRGPVDPRYVGVGDLGQDVRGRELLGLRLHVVHVDCLARALDLALQLLDVLADGEVVGVGGEGVGAAGDAAEQLRPGQLEVGRGGGAKDGQDELEDEIISIFKNGYKKEKLKKVLLRCGRRLKLWHQQLRLH